MKFYIDFQCQNVTKRYSENRENAYLAMKNPSASGALSQAPDPQPTSACFTTSAIFAKRNLDPPLTKSWIHYWFKRKNSLTVLLSELFSFHQLLDALLTSPTLADLGVRAWRMPP